MPVPRELDELTAERDALAARLEAVQSQQVREWLDLIRHGTVIPSFIEQSFSWRVTKPFRLAKAALSILRREGFARVAAATGDWIRRRLGSRSA